MVPLEAALLVQEPEMMLQAQPMSLWSFMERGGPLGSGGRDLGTALTDEDT